MRREIINPHDKITIDYSDQEAADCAVIVAGEGRYGIDGDDGLPLLLFGGHEEWCSKKHGCSIKELLERVGMHRLATALESMLVEGKRTSMSDPVGWAHKTAQQIREKEGAK